MNKTIPPCGHTNRETQLTELAVPNLMGNVLYFQVCTVPTCKEFCRLYCDLQDSETDEGYDARAG